MQFGGANIRKTDEKAEHGEGAQHAVKSTS
jgi:hypothetical protein